jgi:hypothetical protein
MNKAKNTRLTFTNIFSISLVSLYILSITLGPALKINSSNNPFVLADINGQSVNKQDYSSHVRLGQLLDIDYCKTEEAYVLFQVLKAEAKHRSIIVDEQEITAYIKKLNNKLLTIKTEESNIANKSERLLLRSLIKDIILVEKVKEVMGFPSEVKPMKLKARVQLESIIFDPDLETVPELSESKLKVLAAESKLVNKQLLKVEYVDVPIESQFTNEELTEQAQKLYRDCVSNPTFRTPERRSANIYKIPMEKRSDFEAALRSGNKDRISEFISYKSESIRSEPYMASNILDIVFALGQEGDYHGTLDGTYVVLTRIKRGYLKPFETVQCDAISYIKQDELFYLRKRALEKNAEYFNQGLEIKTAWVNSVKPNVLHPELQYKIFTEKAYAGSFALIPDSENPTRREVPQTVRVFRVSQILVTKSSDIEIEEDVKQNYRNQVIKQRLETYAKNKVFGKDSTVVIELSDDNYLYPGELISKILKNPEGVHYHHNKAEKVLYVFKVQDFESNWDAHDITAYVSTPADKYQIIKKLWKQRGVSSNKFKPIDLC